VQQGKEIKDVSESVALVEHIATKEDTAAKEQVFFEYEMPLVPIEETPRYRVSLALTRWALLMGNGQQCGPLHNVSCAKLRGWYRSYSTSLS
jgi:hypothetical protein